MGCAYGSVRSMKHSFKALHEEEKSDESETLITSHHDNKKTSAKLGGVHKNLRGNDPTNIESRGHHNSIHHKMPDLQLNMHEKLKKHPPVASPRPTINPQE